MATLEEVVQAERQEIVRRRTAAFPLGPTPAQPQANGRPRWDETNVGNDLVGLALSGGGIRSAMFNLGLLQALHTAGLIRYVDYLSTVSGGSYIGAHYSSQMLKARQ